jgi:NADPH:quinone reductase
MKAIRIHAPGGPEVLQYEDVPLPEPGPGEVRVQLKAIGINYIDVYQRTGLYQHALPFTPGMEGAGVVDKLGPDVTDTPRVGDPVSYSMIIGSYAEYAIVPADKLVDLPGADYRLGAALTLQGLTAHYLTHSTFPLKQGHTVLLHAAGGGVGLLLAQMAKAQGATVYGTVSTDEKARLAREAGVDEIIRYTQVDFVAEVKRLTGGRGVDVVFDSVGKDTFDGSLASLRPRGMLVLCGQSSGAVPAMSPSVLAGRSLYLTRPMLDAYIQTRQELQSRSNNVFDSVAKGRLKVHIGQEFPLAEAAAAHLALQDRNRVGKVLLIP